MAGEVSVLDLWASPFGMRVRIALREKGVQFKSMDEDLDNKSPLLLQMNPVYKQVPVLIHNGNPVSESTIIVQYIDEVWSDKAPLLPSDPYDRSHARFWTDYVDKNVYGIAMRVLMSWGEAQEAAKKELIECFKVLELELGDKTYFGGNTFGLVDVSLIPFYSWFYSIETLGKMSVKEECAKLVAWAERCMQRESVVASMPDHQKLYTDVVLGLKADYESRLHHHTS